LLLRQKGFETFLLSGRQKAKSRKQKEKQAFLMHSVTTDERSVATAAQSRDKKLVTKS